MDVVGKTGAVEPLQMGAMALKVGVVTAIVKLWQAAGATLPQRSVTEPEVLTRQAE